ncbi:hypothetical protein AWB82_06188 [Caballeronia glebae]|uniref:Uncharacterized protein n=1 Tax=Caballeronia glebae TaxID=1777143 RepID=A0A158D2I9_9BURK|nr:hypothetical protein AWB82_06188 [Caballeronia glebae]
MRPGRAAIIRTRTAALGTSEPEVAQGVLKSRGSLLRVSGEPPDLGYVETWPIVLEFTNGAFELVSLEVHPYLPWIMGDHVPCCGQLLGPPHIVQGVCLLFVLALEPVNQALDELYSGIESLVRHEFV